MRALSKERIGPCAGWLVQDLVLWVPGVLDYQKWEVRELRPPLYSGVRNYGPPKMHILREPFSISSHTKAILESGKEKRQAQKAR